MKNSSKIFPIITILIFLLSIFVPLAGAIFQEDRALSYTEKRKLTQLPNFPNKLSNLKEYLKVFEGYYNDQFGFRNIFLSSYARVKNIIGDYEIASSSTNVGTKNIIKGKDGWYFLNRKWDGDPISDYRNIDLYSPAELWRATLFFAARADWLKRRDIEYLFFFAPNKHTIYSEYLPDYIQKVGDISSLDQLKDSLGRYTTVHFVDLREILLEGKKEASRYWHDSTTKKDAALYFKMDSHWNGAGADIAQFAIARKIEELFPGKIFPYKRPVEDFTMFRFTGDITRIMGRTEEEAYGPVLMRGKCVNNSAEDFLQRKHQTYCKDARLNALIFNDSFFPPLKPYFSDYFRHAVYRWERMTLGEVEKQIIRKKPDIVIEERAERHLPFTPVLQKGEDYGAFWQANWNLWSKSVFILDLKDTSRGKYPFDHMSLKYEDAEDELQIEAMTNDPVFFLPTVPLKNNRLYLAKIEITSDRNAILQLFYSETKENSIFPSENLSLTSQLSKGQNTVYLPLFSLDCMDINLL